LRKREEELRREKARVEKSSERLVTAYQEGLLTLPQGYPGICSAPGTALAESKNRLIGLDRP
jgi:hypothetical protein